jgi:hypothetical protein
VGQPVKSLESEGIGNWLSQMEILLESKKCISVTASEMKLNPSVAIFDQPF